MNNEPTQTDRSAFSLTPWHWGWSAALAAIVLVTLAFRYALPVRDGDLWFHMLYGKYFLENMTLIADHTIFSWTPTTNDTIYVTWLPDIFLYLLHKVAGLPGIFAFRYLCMLVPVLGCFLYARKLKIASHPLTWLLCLLAVIMSYTAAFEKPEILSFVFMTLLAWNWWHIRSSGEEAWKNCYLFPAIMLVWVNTHGGFVFGAVFLVLIGLGELLNTWLSPHNALSARLRKHLLIALLLAAATPLLTPYSFHYPLQLFRDLLPTRENISFNNKIAAYAPTFAANDDSYNFTLCADLAIAFLILFFCFNFKRIEFSTLLPNLVFAFLYTQFLRTTFYWVPVFLFSSLSMLPTTSIRLWSWQYAQTIFRVLPILIMTASGWIAWDTLYKAYTRPEAYLWMGFGISDGNPVAETEYIKKYFPQARIGNTYEQGAYLLWELWPKNKVFFDARHFPYRAWSDMFFNFSAGNDIQAMTKKYPCDLWCIKLTNTRLLYSMLQSKDWHLAFYGKNAAVLLRNNIPLPHNAPKYSADIFESKNIYAASSCFTFACYLKDWETAKKMLTAITTTFTHASAQPTVRWAQHYFNGLTAFYNRRYSEAVSHLELLGSRSTYIRYTLATCYHYLTREAWQNGDDVFALTHARKAWDMVPDTSYSLYNLGTIIWQQERTLGAGTEKRPDWRRFLQEFLRITPDDREFSAFLPLAWAMLNGVQQERPPLLIPPEPTSARADDLKNKNALP